MQPSAIGTIPDYIASDIETSTIGRITWRFVPLLALSYIVSMIDRVNVGFAALTANHDLHLSASAYGWGAGIFFISYSIFGYPSNKILANVGARRWLATIMITWGVISGCMALIIGVKSFYLVRFMLGAAEAGLFPGLLLYITLWFPRRYRARYIGLMLIGMPMSALIGSPISGLLLTLNGFLGLHGWQWLYLLEALPAILIGIATILVLSDTPAKATWLNPDQRYWLVQELAKDPPAPGRDVSLLALLRSRRVWFYAMIWFNITASAFGLIFWLPTIIKAAGLPSTHAAYITAIPYFFGVVAMIFWGRFSDWTNDRIRTTAAATFLASISLVIAVLLKVPALQLIAMCFATAGIYALKGPNMSLVTESFSGAAASGGIAVVSALGNLSGFLPPFIVGWIKDLTGGFTGGLLFLATLAFLGGVQVLFTNRFEASELRRLKVLS